MRRLQLPLTALIVTLLAAGTNAFAPVRTPSLKQQQTNNGASFRLNEFAFQKSQKVGGGGPVVKTTQRSTSLSMAAPAAGGFALAAITGAISGGFFAGGLHAMSGTLLLVAGGG